jgi:hypothetical protein
MRPVVIGLLALVLGLTPYRQKTRKRLPGKEVITVSKHRGSSKKSKPAKGPLTQTPSPQALSRGMSTQQ